MSATDKASVITGPTSGMGRATALELAKLGKVVLVGRDRGKLDQLERFIRARGQQATSVVCDLSDVVSIARAVSQIVGLGLPIAGLMNNAGVMQSQPTRSAQGWDLTFVTNHLGPFVFTETLVPHLAKGTHILFVGSAVEDPERKPAVAAGFRGARGEWKPGGSAKPGMDAYATSKQCVIATALALARERPSLRINAVEPGFNPATGLGGADAGAFVRFLQRFLVPLVVPLIMPFVKILTTSKRAGRMLSALLVDGSAQSGVYFDEGGKPMRGSPEVHDPNFQDRVVAETRAFLSKTPAFINSNALQHACS
jgi:NAD(P)-dependent dehydrogenase (short-subunit alcohol dehydrogenase family)